MYAKSPKIVQYVNTLYRVMNNLYTLYLGNTLYNDIQEIIIHGMKPILGNIKFNYKHYN